MSLHGVIRVNHKTIGTWSATRKPGIDLGSRAVYGYSCTAEMVVRDRPARVGDVVTFDLEHTYSDGAFVLASEVTARAAQLLAATSPQPANPVHESGNG
ncbi:hypothetical protein [Nocardioides sp.]|uniref:hypothetical protein n=1 Tax=Nocardioides sp. TaxID=35761 RepID=UPI002609CB8B|nr:hypothetical protein [Nocardioides sp.]